MNKFLKENIIHHYKEKAPYQWSSIKRKLSKQLADDLLTSLERLSDPQGKELIDFRSEYLDKINKNKRIGA